MHNMPPDIGENWELPFSMSAASASCVLLCAELMDLNRSSALAKLECYVTTSPNGVAESSRHGRPDAIAIQHCRLKGRSPS